MSANDFATEAELQAYRRTCQLGRLRLAAQEVIDRWDSPLWKDAPATAVFINNLRRALEETK
jgi:hypothetical protein